MHHITLNQFAEYSAARTDKAKNRIIKQQENPDKLRIIWYQLAKGAIKKHLRNVKDKTPLYRAIEKLLARETKDKHKLNDKKVSIEALERMVELNIARYFKDYKYEVIKTNPQPVNIDGVSIRISPEVIVKIIIDGKTVFGGVKIHISKRKPFAYRQCQYSSVLLSKCITDNFAKDGETVLPELCLTVDVFSNRVVPAKVDFSLEISHIQFICNDIKARWPSES